MPSASQRLVGVLADNWQPLRYGQEVSWRYRRNSRLYKGMIVCFVRSERSARDAMCTAVVGRAEWQTLYLEGKITACLHGVSDNVSFDRYIVQVQTGVRHRPSEVEILYEYRAVPATTIELQNAHLRERGRDVRI